MTGLVHSYGDISGYKIFRDGSLLSIVAGNVYEYIDSGLLSGYYYFTVSAVYVDPTPGESIYVGGNLLINGSGGSGSLLGSFYVDLNSTFLPIYDAVVSLGSYHFDTTGFNGNFGFDVTPGCYNVILRSLCYPVTSMGEVWIGDGQVIECIYLILGEYAEIWGTVKDLITENPIADARLTIQCNGSIFSNSTGFYYKFLDEGSYPIICEAEGYQTVIDTVFITGQTQWNVWMIPAMNISGPCGTNNKAVLVYPVPASNIIYIESQIIITGIKIFNLSGSLVFLKDSINDKSFNLDVSNLQNGIYIIFFTGTGGEIMWHKLVITGQNG